MNCHSLRTRPSRPRPGGGTVQNARTEKAKRSMGPYAPVQLHASRHKRCGGTLDLQPKPSQISLSLRLPEAQFDSECSGPRACIDVLKNAGSFSFRGLWLSRRFWPGRGFLSTYKKNTLMLRNSLTLSVLKPIISDRMSPSILEVLYRSRPRVRDCEEVHSSVGGAIVYPSYSESRTVWPPMEGLFR